MHPYGALPTPLLAAVGIAQLDKHLRIECAAGDETAVGPTAYFVVVFGFQVIEQIDGAVT